MNSQAVLSWLLVCSMAATLGSWSLRPRWQAPAVILCGAILLAIVSPTALALLTGGTFATYILAGTRRLNRNGLIVGVVVIAATLGVFLIGSRPGLASPARLVVPLGSAFFALRLIHYLFESFKGTLRPHGFLEYAHYQFLPSTLASGPIHRFDEFQRDVRRRRWDANGFSLGLERILYGVVKIVVVGNYILGGAGGRLLNGLSVGGATLQTYMSTVIFWTTLYVTFSGYSDVAIGFGMTLGLRLRENFKWPFLARNIGEFWQRWHFSLSSWCRDYVYTPVMASTRRSALAVLVSMVVLGLWHEASLRYILWGAYHGGGIAAFRWFDSRAGAFIDGLPGWVERGWQVIATLLTLHFVLLSFIVTTWVQDLLAVR